MSNQSIPSLEKNAKLIKWMGIGSIFSIVLAFVLGFAFEEVGINSVLFSLGIPLSLVTIILGSHVIKNITDKHSNIYKEAYFGRKCAIIALVFMIVFVIAVAIFFSWVFRQA